jgi:hypothetical protein
LDKCHISIGLGTINARTGEIALARKDEIVSDRLDLDTIRNTIQIADDFLEICCGQIDHCGIFHIGNHEFFRIGFDQSQLLTVTLFDISIVVLETKMRNNTIMIVVVFDIHCEGVVIGHCRNHLEQVDRIGAYDDFLGMTRVFLEFVGVEDDIDQDGMCFVEIDDFKTATGIRDRGISEDVFDCRDHITNGLNLYCFDGEDIIGFVHFDTSNKKVLVI